MDRIAGRERHAHFGQIEFRHAAERANGACIVADIHLLDADRQRHIGRTTCDLKPSAAQRGHSAGAGIFDIDDRNAGNSRMLEYDLAAHALLAGQQAAERIADIGDVDVGGLDAGILDGPPNRRVG